jgi:hypothetical protein
MKAKKGIVIAGSVLIATGILLYIYSQDALKKKRQRVDDTIVPPGYASQMAARIIAGIKQ